MDSSAEKYAGIISLGCDYILSDVESYAMMRILNTRQILKFTDDPIADPKYSILAEDEILGGESIIEIDQDKNYNVNYPSDLSFINTKQNSSIEKINFQDLANSLFGYPRLQTSNLNLPHISGSVSLMLD